MTKDKKIIESGKAVMTRGVARLAGIDTRFSGFIKNCVQRYMEEVSPQYGDGLFYYYEDDGLPGISIVREIFPYRRITVLLAGEY